MYDMAYATNLQASFGNMYMYMYSWMACLYYFRPRAGRKQGSTPLPCGHGVHQNTPIRLAMRQSQGA